MTLQVMGPQTSRLGIYNNASGAKLTRALGMTLRPGTNPPIMYYDLKAREREGRLFIFYAFARATCHPPLNSSHVYTSSQLLPRVHLGFCHVYTSSTPEMRVYLVRSSFVHHR